MISIEQRLDMAASPEAVFAVLTHPLRYPGWLPGVLSGEVLSGQGPGSVTGEGTSTAVGTTGSRFRVRVQGPMGPIDVDAEVLESRPPGYLRVKADSALFALAATCTIGTAGPVSRLDAAAQLELKGLARFLEGQLRGQIERGLPAALAQLRAAIEAEAARVP